MLAWGWQQVSDSQGERGRRLAIALGLMVLMGACAHSAPPPEPCKEPPPFSVLLEASERLNPDDKGNSLATIVQVLQLKDIRRLEASEFQDVWQKPKEVLEEDLLATDELTLEPGQELTRQLSRDPKANFIVVFGVFRRPAGQVWRSIQRLPEVTPELCAAAKKPGQPVAPMHFYIEDYRVEARGRAGGR
ncbi:type VI secretion system lipoprotein TssJ [Hyalangium rubrum]|uniref:Type VI secretion system lipoprotein TssJ n=1 Tax=Hyalangium rubrum TaxID=3103134 RepID=A0ABU5HC66_9BACT|nr:type VI secretion system lipoprotein TssJ [Hyalangium sp. s54d21]MDY7230936.1 type VI secretion system lipoprotein TssJ [Hyalangium sp. s54d21]